MAWERCSRDEIYIQTATGTPVIAEGYQDSDRTTGLGSQDGIVPDKVSDREAGPPVIAEGYQDSDRTLQKRLECQNGIVPDKVSDREAGTNRSGNTGRTRLLNMKGRWSFFFTL